MTIHRRKPGPSRGMLPAIVVILFAPNCSFIPAYTYVNDPRPEGKAVAKRGVGQFSMEKVPSGSDAASGKTNWDINLKCRNTLGERAGAQRAQCESNDTDFVGIAMSGGGSRAAVFSAAVLFELDRWGLLDNVDVISSVSGGSFTAAFYALSCDSYSRCPATVEGPKRFLWNKETVFPLLERNYIIRWFGNWFWPENIVRYWFTHYDRTNIMAETLSDNLFDNSQTGNEGFRFHDLNPERPDLIINATSYTSTPPEVGTEAGTRTNLEHFTFTKDRFEEMESDIEQFPIADAVVASAAFPGAFQYVTLRDFRKREYLHLFDGGTYDNLGLDALEHAINKANGSANGPERRIVILIDAYTRPTGKSPSDPDPREVLDYIVDTNFLDAFDTLLAASRNDTINKWDNWREVEFVHLTFDSLVRTSDKHDELHRLYEKVNRIGTSLSICDEDADSLRDAARILVDMEMTKRCAEEGSHIAAMIKASCGALPSTEGP